MSDAVPSSEVKAPEEKAEQPAANPKDSETTNDAGPSDSKKEEPNAEKAKTKQSSKGGKIGDQDPTAENEIRVAAKGAIKNYLGYAFRILNKTDHRSLTIRATGNAIVKALILIELVKRRVGELHQLNKIYSMEIVSHEDSKIEGMEKIETRRRVTAMDTTLSKDPLDDKDPGYQEPLPKEEQASTPTQKQPREPKKPKADSKGGAPKGKKLYNALPPKDGKDQNQDGEQKQDKQRRDNQKANKHEQDKEDGKHNKDGKNYQRKGDRKRDHDGGNARGGPGKDEKTRSRKEHLKQNTVKDDEDRYKRREPKGG